MVMSDPVLTWVVKGVSFFKTTKLSMNLELWTIEVSRQEYEFLSSQIALLLEDKIQELKIKWPALLGEPIPLREEFVLYLKKGFAGRSLLAHPEPNYWVASMEMPGTVLQELVRLTQETSFRLSEKMKIIYPNNFDLFLKIN